MLKFEIKSRLATLGDRKGELLYYAYPITQDKITIDTLLKRIERETSLTAGDVQNALTSMTHIICEALSEGRNVDLGDLGAIRLVVPSKMMDKKEDVTVTKALENGRLLGDDFQFVLELEGGPEGYLSLAVAHIPADQAVHDMIAFHVALDLLDTLQLIRRLGKGKGGLELHLPVIVRTEGMTE